MATDRIESAIHAGNTACAQAEYDRALERFEAAIRRADDEGDPRVVDALNGAARALESMGRYAESEKQLVRATAIAEGTLGSGHIWVARSLNALGGTLRLAGRLTDASVQLQRGLEIAQGAGDKGLHDTIAIQNSLALIAAQQGASGPAERRYLEVLKLLESRGVPEDLALAEALGNLGDLYRATDRADKALSVLSRAKKLSQALAPGSPQEAVATLNLALFHETTGQASEAEALFREAQALLESADGQHSEPLANVHLQLAKFYIKADRSDDAQGELERSTQLSEAVKPFCAELASALELRGELLTAGGDKSGGEALMKKAADVRADAKRRASGVS